MAKTQPRIRWLTNVYLNVKSPEGEISERLFKSGSYTAISKVVQYPDGYGDVYLGKEYIGQNQHVIEGIKLGEGYELHGQVDVKSAEYSGASPKDVPAAPSNVAPPSPNVEETTKKKPPKRKWTQGW